MSKNSEKPLVNIEDLTNQINTKEKEAIISLININISPESIRSEDSDKRLAHYYALLAFIYFKEGDIELAKENYTQCNKYNKKNPSYYMVMAKIYLNEGKYAEVVKCCDSGLINIEDHSMYSILQAFRGRGYFELGMKLETQDKQKSQQFYVSAIQDFDIFIQENPKNDEAYDFRGRAYLKIGIYNAALKDFNRAIMLEPHKADYYCSRAQTYLQEGQYDQMIRDINSIIYLKPAIISIKTVASVFNQKELSENLLIYVYKMRNFVDCITTQGVLDDFINKNREAIVRNTALLFQFNPEDQTITFKDKELGKIVFTNLKAKKVIPEDVNNFNKVCLDLAEIVTGREYYPQDQESKQYLPLIPHALVKSNSLFKPLNSTEALSKIFFQGFLPANLDSKIWKIPKTSVQKPELLAVKDKEPKEKIRS